VVNEVEVAAQDMSLIVEMHVDAVVGLLLEVGDLGNTANYGQKTKAIKKLRRISYLVGG
jgi:hypothetical protein